MFLTTVNPFGVMYNPASVLHTLERMYADETSAFAVPDVAVLCVPKTMANEVAKEVCACGVHSIWNFTNTELQLEDTDVIVENIHFSDSLLALGYYLSESLDEAEAKAARARKDV